MALSTSQVSGDDIWNVIELGGNLANVLCSRLTHTDAVAPTVEDL